MIFVNPYSKVNTDMPNLSLAYAATVFNAKVVDFNTRPGSFDALFLQNTPLLGISVRSMNEAEAGRIASKYRSAHPDSQVVSVGTGIDIQCCYPFKEWEKHLAYAKQFSDDYPFPEFQRFDSFELFQDHWRHGRWHYTMLSSLGCPFPCNYCMCRKRKWRPRSAENCFHELKQAQEKWGIKSFFLIDDCFNVDRTRVMTFCELVAGLNLTWHCANGLRADLFDENMAAALAAAGCVQVSFGIESIHDPILKAINKSETFEKIEAAVRIATKYFQSVNGFFIIGLPGSSYELDLQSLQWAQSVGINAHFSYFVPSREQIPANEVFYGDGAKPLSTAYPAHLQEKLYQRTSQMRPSVLPNCV